MPVRNDAARYQLNHPQADGNLGNIQLEADEACAYHRSLPIYAATPLVGLPNLAQRIGVAAVWVKDESSRFGLNAFKVLGASYATHRIVAAADTEAGSEKTQGAKLTFTTATDGNHGRAVASSARNLGHAAVIFVPAGTVPARVAAIESEAARVVVVDGDYDQAVRTAEQAARDHGWVLVQDSAWPGYTTIPAWIMAGYTTILRELVETLLPPREPAVDCVLLQAGVGSWPAAATWYLRARYGPNRPRIVCVEPTAADCLLESATAGRLASSRGSGQTLMAGLNCGTPSSLAWPILRQGADAFLAIPDDYAVRAVRMLYRPIGGDPRITAGESGAAGLAALLAIMEAPSLADLRSHLGLGPTARVLVVNTEGATDPESFARIVDQSG